MMTIKKLSILALVVCLVLALLSPSMVQARSGITVLDSSAVAEFPYRLSFNLSVESDADITDIRLQYTIDRVSFAQVISEVYIEFTPSTIVGIEWTLDMRKVGGLPPGSSIDYWWTVKDANGENLETAPVSVSFTDNRYSWRSITEDNITIYWYEGSQSFAQELMVSAQQALARLDADTGVRLEKQADIYIYNGSGDLLGALIYPQEWTGGIAFTRYSVIAIGIAADELYWGKRAIAHELTHLVTHQMTLNPYSDLPTWLDEGLAMYIEGALEPIFATYLSQAINEDSLISVRSLSSPFSAYAEESYLAYAQSYSLVEFLISNYGQENMLELLSVFREGSSYDGALDRVYGFDMDGLNALWRDYVTKQYQEAEVTAGAPSPVLSGASAKIASEPVLDLEFATKN